MTLSGVTIGGKYRISEKIGNGAFGEIYRGVDTETLDEVAMKTEKVVCKVPQLRSESKIYCALAGGTGVPTIHWFGIANRHNIMVMDILGKSLLDLFELCGDKLSLKTVLMLADQMISCVQFIHEKNFIHRDLKPENFLMGVNQASNEVFLIDFGLAKNYRDPRSHTHIPYQEGRGLTGTARYASVNSLAGIEQSRRDDMEALGYIWVYLLRGKLPWMGLKASGSKQKCKAIKDVKEHVKIEELCSGLPKEFENYFFQVRQLRFSDRPNYEHYRELFRQAFIREGFVYDYKYDWTDKIPTFTVVKGEDSKKETPIVLSKARSSNMITSNDLFPLPVKPLFDDERRPRSVKKKTAPLPRVARLAMQSPRDAATPRKRVPTAPTTPRSAGKFQILS